MHERDSDVAGRADAIEGGDSTEKAGGAGRAIDLRASVPALASDGSLASFARFPRSATGCWLRSRAFHRTESASMALFARFPPSGVGLLASFARFPPVPAGSCLPFWQGWVRFVALQIRPLRPTDPGLPETASTHQRRFVNRWLRDSSPG